MLKFHVKSLCSSTSCLTKQKWKRRKPPPCNFFSYWVCFGPCQPHSLPWTQWHTCFVDVFSPEPREPRKRSMYFKDHSSPTRRRYRFSSTGPRSPYSSRRANRLARRCQGRDWKVHLDFEGIFLHDRRSSQLSLKELVSTRTPSTSLFGCLQLLWFQGSTHLFIFFLIFFSLPSGIVLRGKILTIHCS